MSTIMPRKKSKQAIRFNIRWMIHRDIPSVLEIESLSFSDRAWDEVAFRQHIGKRNTIGMVAELDDEVVGFMVYELHTGRIHILNFAVHPKFRRMGIGSSMMDKLIYKLSFERRNRIELGVADHNLGAHLFFKSCGMRCEKVNFDEDIQQDWYHFIYRVGKES